MLVHYKDWRYDGDGSVMAICALCWREIARLSPNEYSALSAEPDGYHSPGLICDKCAERQCDHCGQVVATKSGLKKLPKGWQVCRVCEIQIEDISAMFEREKTDYIYLTEKGKEWLGI